MASCLLCGVNVGHLPSVLKDVTPSFPGNEPAFSYLNTLLGASSNLGCDSAACERCFSDVVSLSQELNRVEEKKVVLRQRFKGKPRPNDRKKGAVSRRTTLLKSSTIRRKGQRSNDQPSSTAPPHDVSLPPAATANVVAGPEASFRCEECAKCFAQKRYLLDHLKRTHKTSLYRCDECNLSFTLKSELSRHRASPSSTCGLEYTCHKCEKAFHTPDQLSRHREDNCNDDNSRDEVNAAWLYAQAWYNQ